VEHYAAKRGEVHRRRCEAMIKPTKNGLANISESKATSLGV